MKIITYNVNGLRAAVGKGLPEWLAQEQPDVLCLQETKLQPDQYPAEVFEALGYKSYLYSAQKKGYSGVAILTKQEPDHVEYGMGIEAYDNEEMCQEIAAAGHGTYVRADNTNSALRALQKEIDKMNKSELDSKVYSEYDERFQTFAWIALILLLVDFMTLDRKNRVFKKVKLFS